MDNQKDIIIKDTESTKDIALKYSFSKSSSLIYIYKKTERIATAIYLITNYFDRDEPLKMSLRKIANTVLKNVLSYNKGDLLERGVLLKKINDDFLEIISYFEIALVAGILSENNYQIIASEVKKVILQIEEITRTEKQDYFIESEFFNVNLPKLDPRQEAGKIFPVDKNKIEKSFPQNNFGQRGNITPHTQQPQQAQQIHKGQSFSPMSFKGTKDDFMSFMNKGLADKKTKGTATGVSGENKGHAESKNLERRSMIIEEIKIKGEVTIKDISEKIHGVSEKTIQRELLKLVEENVLKKEGERRWSKYSLRG